MSWIAVAIGGGTAISAGIGAVSASKARKQAAADAKKSQAAWADSVAGQQAALEGLYAEMPNPAEVFKEILLSMPGLLDQVLPALRGHAKSTAEDFTRSNLATYDIALSHLSPEQQQQKANRLRILDELDPKNLGKEEILGTTRALSPLIPVGTLDPSTGAVAGGTTNAVSLYRNLTNSMYQDRRNQFLGETKSLISDNENAAIRQQERASSFLPSFLGLAFESAGGISDATMQQSQSQIAGATGLLNTLLQMDPGGFNSAPYDAAITGNIQNAFMGLASAYAGYKARPAGATATNPSVMSVSGGGRPVGSRPSGLNYYSGLA
jgi:hypothetical protein